MTGGRERNSYANSLEDVQRHNRRSGGVFSQRGHDYHFDDGDSNLAAMHSSRPLRHHGNDVNVAYYGDEAAAIGNYDAVYTDDDAANEVETQPKEPVIPDEDFIPKKRAETDEIVKEKTVSARMMVNQQSNVIDKLRSTSQVS